MSVPDFTHRQIALAFLSHGDKLSFNNDNLVIKDKENKIKHQSTCYRLFTLFIVGHTSVTTGLLQRAKKFNFNIIFMGHNLSPYAKFNCQAEGNTLLRQKQYQYNGLAIAYHIVNNKIMQQERALKRIRQKDDSIKQAILRLNSYSKNVYEMHNKGSDFTTLMGIEGAAARVYFAQMFSGLSWQGRKPRAKQDTINTLLDIGYTLLFNFIEGLLTQYGFDIYHGVYHRQFYQRKSLVCDLVEPFRVIIDYRLRTAYNLGQIDVEDFDYRQGQYHLFGEKAKPYLTFLLEELLEYKVPLFIYIQQYYRCFIRDKAIADYPVFDINTKYSER